MPSFAARSLESPGFPTRAGGSPLTGAISKVYVSDASVIGD